MPARSGKIAANVAKGDERLDNDGRRHRVVFKTVGLDGHVSIAYDAIHPTGGKSLHFETVARDAVTDFTTPSVDGIDDDQSA